MGDQKSICDRTWSLFSWQRTFDSRDRGFSVSGSHQVTWWPRLELSWYSKQVSISTEILLISPWVNMWENIVGSVQNPYVISRCGIFNGQSSDLPHYPHTKLTTHTPSLISPPSLSLPPCLMYAFIHALTQLGLWPLQNTNKVCMCGRC